ncbi:MAG: InlB B-repeat-containing protein, partial [Bacilli bacterium]|nr:InlB B-repeat-containing protein [Bacilli bacterium]
AVLGFEFTTWSKTAGEATFDSATSRSTNVTVTASNTSIKGTAEAASTNKVTVTLKKDGSNCTTCDGYTIGVSSSNSTYTAVSSASGTTTTSSTIDLTGAIVPGTTYYLWVGKDANHKTTTVYSGVSFRIPYGNNATTITVNFYLLTVSLANTTVKVNGTSVSNNGTVVVLGGTGTASSSYEHAIEATAANNYEFSGIIWTKTGTMSIGSNSTASTTLKVASGGTITATAIGSSYSITYKDCENTTFSGTHENGYPTSYTYGVGATLDTPTKTGYNFDGYFEASACSGDAVTSISNTATGDKTLYAKWDAKTPKVTLIDSLFTSVASQTSNGVTVTYDSSAQTLTFNGTVSTGSSGLTLFSYGMLTNMTFSSSSTYKLLLVYVEGSRTDTYNPTIGFEFYKDGAQYSNRANGTHYTNATMPTNSTSTTNSLTGLSDADSVRFYTWVPANSSVTFTNYKVRVLFYKVYEKTVTYNSAYGTLDTPSKPGFKFDGWYTTTTGSTVVTSSTIVTNEEDHYLYAHWTPNTITLNVQKNGSACTSCSGYSVSLSSSSSSDDSLLSGTTTTASTLTLSSESSNTNNIIAGTTYYIWVGKDSNHKSTRINVNSLSAAAVAGNVSVNIQFFTVTINGNANTVISVNGTTVSNATTTAKTVDLYAVPSSNNYAHAIVSAKKSGLTNSEKYYFDGWNETSGATVNTHYKFGSTTSASTTLKIAKNITINGNWLLDNTKPVATIVEVKTVNNTERQYVVVKCEDSGSGVESVYWQGSSAVPTATSSDWETISGGPVASWTSSGTNSGSPLVYSTAANTHYLGCMDAVGNWTDVSSGTYSYKSQMFYNINWRCTNCYVKGTLANGNQSSGTTGISKTVIGKGSNIKLPTPTKTSGTLQNGWYKNSNFSGKAGNWGANYGASLTGSTNLYAHAT